MCDYRKATRTAVWECEQPDCNGTNHFMVAYPYVKHTIKDELHLLAWALVMGFALAYIVFGMKTL